MYKVTTHYGFGWTDPRAVFNQPSRPARPMEWICSYCRSYHLITIDQCPNCGAPRYDSRSQS